MLKKLYVLYDGRAIPWEKQCKDAKDMITFRQLTFGDGEDFKKQFFPGDTDHAAIFETDHSLKQLRKTRGQYGAPGSMCIYSYDIEMSTAPGACPPKNNCLINETFVEVL